MANMNHEEFKKQLRSMSFLSPEERTELEGRATRYFRNGDEHMNHEEFKKMVREINKDGTDHLDSDERRKFEQKAGEYFEKQ